MPLTENFNQDAAGNTTVAGTGVAGTPAGGVLSIQGQAAMTPLLSTGTGTAGTPAVGVVTVQGITGGSAIPVLQASAATGTITSVASSAASVTLLASNVNRKGFILYNNSTQTCKVAFAAAATAASFTVLLQANSVFESQSLYTGVISGIWAAANGAMLVTELT